MSDRNTRKGDRFRWWLSDRSGFQFGFTPLTTYPNAYSRESGRPIKDNGIQICPSEYDQPPPSTKPLGGEGEIGTGARDNSSPSVDSNVYLVPAESLIPVTYVNSSQSIAWNNEPVVFIAGSNAQQIMASNPQMQSAENNKQICFMCVGSSITLNNGNGLALHTPSYVMQSGSLLNLLYQTANSLWYETSRGSLYGDLGAL